jgi:hypothetical protein
MAAQQRGHALEERAAGDLLLARERAGEEPLRKLRAQRLYRVGGPRARVEGKRNRAHGPGLPVEDAPGLAPRAIREIPVDLGRAHRVVLERPEHLHRRHARAEDEQRCRRGRHPHRDARAVGGKALPQPLVGLPGLVRVRLDCHAKPRGAFHEGLVVPEQRVDSRAVSRAHPAPEQAEQHLGMPEHRARMEHEGHVETAGGHGRGSGSRANERPISAIASRHCEKQRS